jgi:hypothetical protein
MLQPAGLAARGHRSREQPWLLVRFRVEVRVKLRVRLRLRLRLRLRVREQPRRLCQLELPALLRVPKQRLVAAPPPQRHLREQPHAEELAAQQRAARLALRTRLPRAPLPHLEDERRAVRPCRAQSGVGQRGERVLPCDWRRLGSQYRLRLRSDAR